jgi:hypothetical protein
MPTQMDLPALLEFSFSVPIGKLLKLWIPLHVYFANFICIQVMICIFNGVWLVLLWLFSCKFTGRLRSVTKQELTSNIM